MTELEEIFHRNTKSSHKWTAYFEVYQRHIQRYRDSNIHLVEVGIQKGGSLEMWGNFLGPQAKITGIDVDENCANLEYDNPNINVLIGNQGDDAFWNDSIPKLGDINVFLDDGSHECDHMILTFEKIFPLISVGGIYIAEDCHTSYWNSHKGGLYKPDSFIEYSKHFVDVLNYDWKKEHNEELDRKANLAKDLSGLFFYDSIVVFEKFGKRGMNHVFPKGLQRD